MSGQERREPKESGLGVDSLGWGTHQGLVESYNLSMGGKKKVNFPYMARWSRQEAGLTGSHIGCPTLLNSSSGSLGKLGGRGSAGMWEHECVKATSLHEEAGTTSQRRRLSHRQTWAAQS